MVMGMAVREIGELRAEGITVCPEGRLVFWVHSSIGGVWGHGQGGCSFSS